MKKVLMWLAILILFGLMMCTVVRVQVGDNDPALIRIETDTIQ